MQATRNNIPIGKENAISRAALCRLWGCPDREARRIVARLRAEPSDDAYAILSNSTHVSGYWRSNDPVEIRAFIAETEGRGRSIFLALRDAKRVLEEQKGAEQLSFL